MPIKDTIKKPKNKGGRPKKTEIQRKIDSGEIDEEVRERLDSDLMAKLIKAQDRAINGLEVAFGQCNDPQKKTAAILNLRMLMNDIGGGRKADRQKAITSIVKDLNGEDLTMEKILEIGSSGRSRSEIASIMSRQDNCENDK